MEVYYTTNPLEAWELSKKCLLGESGIIIVKTIAPCVWTGRLNTFDKNYCEENNIQVAYGLYLGGSIVAFPGDLSIMWVTWGKTDAPEQAVLKILNILKEKGIDAEIDENDVIADGKKVASWAGATTLNGWYQGVFHASINTDLELINKICTKPMDKIPGQLSDYGINAEMVLDEIQKVIENESS